MIPASINHQLLRRAAPNGFAALWAMDSFDGTTVYDQTKNNNDLTISGATTGVPGIIGQAVSFDGNNNKLVGDNTTFNYSRNDPFSVAFWINFDATPSAFKAFCGTQSAQGVNDAKGWLIRNGGPGLRRRLAFIMYSDPDAALYEYTSADVLTTGWHHICLTYDGSSSRNGIKLYWDAQSQALTSDGSATISGETVTNENFSIGSRDFDNGGSIDGDIDQFYIYERELTAAEVLKLYREP